MVMLSMVISISYYLLFIFISVYMSARYYRRKSSRRAFLRSGHQLFERVIGLSTTPKYKMTLGMIFLITFLCFLYNALATNLGAAAGVVGYDRHNYSLNFYGLRPAQGAGLTFIIFIIRQFTSNLNWLWYVATLIVMPITLLAYRISREATPSALFFFLTTQYIFLTFVNMKQCYACGLVSLCLIVALRNNGLRDKIYCALLMALAYAFHPTALIALPLCIIIWVKKSDLHVAAFFLAIAVSILTLKWILPLAGSVLAHVTPWLASKIVYYLNMMESENKTAEASLLTATKGIPWYMITILGCAKRRKLKGKIGNYDNYLLLSGTLSVVYLASFYNVWIYRLAYYLYLPVTIFYCQMMRFIRGRDKAFLLYAMVMGLNFLITIRFLILTYLNFGGF